MKITKINIRFSVIFAIILLAAFSRVIPHMPNFSPLGAISLFGAAYFSKKWQAIAIPLMATWLSDLFINNVIYGQYYPEFIWFYKGFYWQYLSYVLIVLFGLFSLKKRSIVKVVSASLASTIIFFTISNFGVWASSNMYVNNLQGLINCYIAGIPFIKGTFLGDLFYTSTLFGAFSWMQSNITVLQPKTITTN